MAKKTNITTEKTTPRAKSAAAPKTAATPRHTKATEPTRMSGSHRNIETVQQLEPQQSPPKFTITHDDIATLAFSYWQRRGYQGGSQQEDWDKAERELRSLLG